jgi:hypothetical protein
MSKASLNRRAGAASLTATTPTLPTPQPAGTQETVARATALPCRSHRAARTCEWTGEAGLPGVFTLASTSSDVEHYLYELDGPPTTRVDAPAPGEPADVELAPSDGPHTLSMVAVDAAGNTSAGSP